MPKKKKDAAKEESKQEAPAPADDAPPEEPKGPTPEEIAKQKADEELMAKIDNVLESFCSSNGGIKTIDYGEVGHAIRACGVFIPEFMVVETELPSLTEAEFEEERQVRAEQELRRHIRQEGGGRREESISPATS